ncbi:MAG TPA: SigE family RNA polymerase sigma factor [Marmoricola sp.]
MTIMQSTTSTTSAYEEYAAAAWPNLYRVAYLLSGAHADAEDLAQQALVKVFRNWGRVSASDSPDAYVRRILTNTYLSSRRPLRLQREVITDRLPDTVVEPGTAAREQRLLLWPHVQALPPRQRAVVVLRYYEDLSEQQIADTLGCSTGTVKSNAHKALNTLRASLSESPADGKEA